MSSAYTEVILHQGFPTIFFEECIPTLKFKYKIQISAPKAEINLNIIWNLAENTVRLEYT